MTEQQKDLLRGATHAKEEYGMARLYEQVVLMIADVNRKDHAINMLLNENERLRDVAKLAAV